MKRKNILHQFKRVLLQETLLTHQSGRRRPVAVLIHRQVHFLATKVHKDSEGRFILVNGSTDGTEVSLMNTYAPNEDEPPAQLRGQSSWHIYGESGKLEILLFIHRHSSYSRIDLFFTLKPELHRTEGMKDMWSCSSSIMGETGHRPTTKHWRLNASLLNDKEFITFVTTELSDYLDINTSPEISPLTL